MRKKCRGIVIRDVRMGDAPKLRRTMRLIARESLWLLTEEDEMAPTLAAERAFIRRHLRSKNSKLLVALCDGDPVGIAGAEGGSRRRNRHTAELGIALREAFRRKGIGTALLRRLFAWARASGVTRLHLCAAVGNRGAIRLYRRLGFVREGISRRSLRIGRRFHDQIEMAKFL